MIDCDLRSLFTLFRFSKVIMTMVYQNVLVMMVLLQVLPLWIFRNTCLSREETTPLFLVLKTLEAGCMSGRMEHPGTGQTGELDSPTHCTQKNIVSLSELMGSGVLSIVIPLLTEITSVKLEQP